MIVNMNCIEMVENANAIPPYDIQDKIKRGMSNYVRYRLPGGCCFFTVNLLQRNK